MERCITREAFCQAVRERASELADAVWQTVVEDGAREGADGWLRTEGGAFLRGVLGTAWTARATRLGMSGPCACGGAVRFRERRPVCLHTVLPGRDVWVTAEDGPCDACARGRWPFLREVGADAEGFTPGLQDLALLAGVLEPYGQASETLLARFAEVRVSEEKIQQLVRLEGPRAAASVQTVPEPEPERGAAADAPVYVGLDGGMVFVEGRWQEVKLGCVFRAEDRTASARRGALTRRHVVAVRGGPEALAARLGPWAAALGA